jgi:hypothetical protein
LEEYVSKGFYSILLLSISIGVASFGQKDPVKKHNGYINPREIEWPVSDEGSENPEVKDNSAEKVTVPQPVKVVEPKVEVIVQPKLPVKPIQKAAKEILPQPKKILQKVPSKLSVEKPVPNPVAPEPPKSQVSTVRKAKGECDISTYMTLQPDGSWSGSQPNNIPDWVGKNLDVQIEYLPNGDIINCVRYTIPDPETGEIKKGPQGNPGELCAFLAYNPANSRGVFMGFHKVTSDRNEKMFRRIEAPGFDKTFELCSDQPTDWEVFGDLKGKETVVISGRKGSTVRGVEGLKVIIRTFDENSSVSCNEHFRKRVVAGEFTSSSDGCSDGNFFKPEY